MTSKRIKRWLSVVAVFVAAMAASTALTSCYDEPGYYDDDDWYLNGTWANMSDYSEQYTFYYDGTGDYETYDGTYLTFDYYCYGGSIYFTFYPSYGPSYTMNCGITQTGGNTIVITYPPTNQWGYNSVTYIRTN